MEKETKTIKEIFCGMPRLYAYFRQMDSTMKRFDPSQGLSEGVEVLKKRKRNLLAIAKGMDGTDLQILYYLHSLQRVNAAKMLFALKKLAAAQEELADLIKTP